MAQMFNAAYFPLKVHFTLTPTGQDVHGKLHQELAFCQIEPRIQWFYTCFCFLECPALWKHHSKHNSNFSLPFSVERQLSKYQAFFRYPIFQKNQEQLESNLHPLKCSGDRNSFREERFSLDQIPLCLGGHPSPRDTTQITLYALKLWLVLARQKWR